ncbi:hypothetical protein V6N11_018389 [Hibiscus sabdariffa]|uniref:Uncharacterized protein n=1 Tax=Hibiscus sabdariffa TaxID=183260 RepID=A0ABR2T783_9ROSI
MPSWIGRTEMKLQNHDPTLKSLETQVGQISQILRSRPIGGFPSDTEVAKGATHEQCKAITIRSGKILETKNEGVRFRGLTIRSRSFANQVDREFVKSIQRSICCLSRNSMCFDVLTEQDDKGDVSNRDNGSCPGINHGGDSDFGRAS